MTLCCLTANLRCIPTPCLVIVAASSKSSLVTFEPSIVRNKILAPYFRHNPVYSSCSPLEYVTKYECWEGAFHVGATQHKMGTESQKR